MVLALTGSPPITAAALDAAINAELATLSAALATETTRATTVEALLAPKASPALTGTPTAPTAAPGTNTTQLASTAFVTGAVVASTTGVASVNTRTGAVTLALSDITGAAPLASPTFTGTPAAPTVAATAAAGTTQLATTAFVRNGTTTNDNAPAGQVGEYISATVLVGAAVALTTNVVTNITSISLTAGDWDVSGSVGFAPAGGTTIVNGLAAINTVSTTLPLASSGAYSLIWPGQTAGAALVVPVASTRISIASTTTVFLIGQAGFITSTMSGYGFIGARRAR